MSRPGWGYHYTPCDGGGSGGSSGLAAVAMLVGAAMLLSAAAPAVESALHVAAVILHWTIITVACVVSGAVIAGLVRLGIAVRRWQLARGAARLPRYTAAPIAPPVVTVRASSGQPAIEAPAPRIRCTAQRVPARARRPL